MTSLRHLMDPAYARRRVNAEYDPHAGVDLSRVAMMCVADPFWPDNRTPAHVRDAAITSLGEDGAHYASPIGQHDLRVEIAAKVARVNGLDVDPDRNITVAGGAESLLVLTARMFLEPGASSEILTPSPSFNTNFEIGPLAGGVTVPVPTFDEDDHDLRIEEFERRLTSRTKVVLITNPNTPTTTVYSRGALERLAEFVQRNDLVLIADQSFEDTVFDGYAMTDVAALPGMADRTILVCSMSKGMAMCGYRVGYAVASADITEVLHSCAPHYFGAANTAAQAAAVAGLRDPIFMDAYRREYSERASLICALLDTVPNLPYTKPQSAFFIWIDVSAYGGAQRVVRYLVEEAEVMPTAGDMFGSGDHIRLVYGTYADRRRCLDAVQRLVAALRSPSAPTSRS